MNPSPALLDEYGLNQVTYHLLLMIITDPDLSTWYLIKRFAAARSITGNPAQSIRKLIDRDLLAGPNRDQPIDARPITVTQRGRDLIDRLHLGLHQPDWLSTPRLAALRRLAAGYATDRQLLAVSHRMSIISLRDAGYIEANIDAWHITALGRQALAEWDDHTLDSLLKRCPMIGYAWLLKIQRRSPHHASHQT